MNSLSLITEKKLIELAVGGRRWAVNHLLLRYQSKIFSQIRIQVSDCSLCHDLVQEVNIKVFRYLPNFKHQSSFSTWLYKIVQNTIKNHFRAMNIDLNYSIDLIREAVDEDNSPESSLIIVQLAQKINDTYRAMPNNLQNCFNLYAVEGLSYEAIAKQLNCPLGTIRSRIHRIKQLLLQSISKSH